VKNKIKLSQKGENKTLYARSCVCQSR